MSQFNVGEVAILQNCLIYPSNNDRECEVIRALGLNQSRYTGEIYHGYIVRTSDGHEWGPAPHQLRKKPPKQSTDEWATEQVAKVTKPVAQPVTEGVPA